MTKDIFIFCWILIGLLLGSSKATSKENMPRSLGIKLCLTFIYGIIWPILMLEIIFPNNIYINRSE